VASILQGNVLGIVNPIEHSARGEKVNIAGDKGVAKSQSDQEEGEKSLLYAGGSKGGTQSLRRGKNKVSLRSARKGQPVSGEKEDESQSLVEEGDPSLKDERPSGTVERGD